MIDEEIRERREQKVSRVRGLKGRQRDQRVKSDETLEDKIN